MVWIKHYCDVSACPQHDLICTPRMLCNELTDIIYLIKKIKKKNKIINKYIHIYIYKPCVSKHHDCEWSIGTQKNYSAPCIVYRLNGKRKSWMWDLEPTCDGTCICIRMHSGSGLPKDYITSNICVKCTVANKSHFILPFSIRISKHDVHFQSSWSMDCIIFSASSYKSANSHVTVDLCCCKNTAIHATEGW